jgi:hypothetical protein
MKIHEKFDNLMKKRSWECTTEHNTVSSQSYVLHNKVTGVGKTCSLAENF